MNNKNAALECVHWCPLVLGLNCGIKIGVIARVGLRVIIKIELGVAIILIIFSPSLILKIL